MKHEIFNQYVGRVTDLFGITKEDFFSKTKKRAIVDARQLVYYLCAKRPMQITYIERYMKEGGYIITHSSIIHGISAVEKKVAEDKDYVSIIGEIEHGEFVVNKYNPKEEETEESAIQAEKKTSNQNQTPQKSQPLMYSDLMSRLRQRLESKNLLTKEPEMKEPKSRQESTIEVTFLNRSKERQDPNSPETEEDGLIAGKLRLLKVRQQFRELTGRTHNLLPLQKTTQKKLEVEEPSLLEEKMTEEQKEATKFAQERGYVMNKGLALYLLYGEAPRDEWEEPIPNWVKKLPEGKAFTKL